MGQQELLDRLQACYALFDSGDKPYERLASLMNEKEKLEKSVNSSALGCFSVIVGLMLMSTGFAIGNIGTLALSGAFHYASSGNSKDFSELSKSTAVLSLIVGAVCAIITAAIPILVLSISRNKKRKRIQAIELEAQPILNEIVARYRSIEQPLVPFKYSDPYFMYPLIKIVEQHRAYSVAEAIAQYEHDLNLQNQIKQKEQELKSTRMREAALYASFVALSHTPREVHVYTD